MKSRDRQIALLGTFDVQNYGDLLFPLIAEAELSERLGAIQLHRFSYHSKKPPDWPYAVTSLTELPQIAGTLDGVIIGGGFILRFDKEVAPGYSPPTPTIHHPTGYWLAPALVALQHGIPLIWNAPGAYGDAPAAFGRFSNDIPEWAEPLMKMVFALSSYTAVRDDLTQAALAPFLDSSQIRVVPDTAFGISRLLNAEPTPEFTRLREASGLTGPYIVIQPTRGMDFFIRFVSRHARALQGFRFLVLPIGPALGNHPDILNANLPGFVHLPEWPHPLLLAELISQAEAVVGPSYHLAITALATGVPVFTTVDPSTGRVRSAFRGFQTLYHLEKETEPDLDWFLQRVGKSAPSAAAREAREQLACHWDRVAAVLKAGVTTLRPEISQFWQSLPVLLENAAVRKDVEVKTNKKVAIKLLEEVKARDDRLALLHNSPSMRVTAPLRFIMRNLKRLIRKVDN